MESESILTNKKRYKEQLTLSIGETPHFYRIISQDWAGYKGVSPIVTLMYAKEWAKYNVQANCVAFGFIDTRLTQEKEKGETVEAGGKKIAVGVPEKRRQIFTKMIPMRRAGTPEEAASTLLFFASPLSDYVSGHVLIVGGGFSWLSS